MNAAINGDRRRPTPALTPVYIAGAAGLLFILAIDLFFGGGSSLRRDMTAAARLMAWAEETLRDCRAEKGVPLDEAADPNRTALIGLESSPVTTSLGSLAAKRTAANPDFAGLVVLLLDEAGVRPGDAVAVGASSSFPSLVIATLAAARALGVEPLVISSLGASEWGANIPAFTWLDMEACLRRAGVLEVRPIALAVGGDEDVGRDMSPAGRELLRTRIRESGLPFIEEPGLAANVRERLRRFEEAAAGRRIGAFVNVGGSWANIGTNAEVLKLRPGLVDDVFVPGPAERGVLQEMAARRVPVIHLLNVKGLCERYGLPWDPRPLPTPGAGALYRRPALRGRVVTWLSAAYILLMAAFLVSRKRSL